MDGYECNIQFAYYEQDLEDEYLEELDEKQKDKKEQENVQKQKINGKRN